MPKYLIIDGYNAINKIKILSEKRDLSLEASRLFFIKIIKDFMAKKRIFDKTFIVFDSKEAEFDVRKDSYGNVDAIFATKDKDADRVIVDMLKKTSSKDKVTISSDDNFIRNHVRAFGKDVISIRELENIIMLKKKGDKSRIKSKDIGNNINNINEELKKHWGIK